MRLLLVDDDTGVRTVVRSTLDEIDFEVVEAGSAAEAPRAVAERLPDVIVLKLGPLDREERGAMQQHAVIGDEILRSVSLLRGEGIAVVRSHHERWDGDGYPDGLAGDAIPLVARLFAVADALDAMTTDRPYRRALPWHTAADEIREQSGTQFDPRVGEAFSATETELRRIGRALWAA